MNNDFRKVPDFSAPASVEPEILLFLFQHAADLLFQASVDDSELSPPTVNSEVVHTTVRFLRKYVDRSSVTQVSISISFSCPLHPAADKKLLGSSSLKALAFGPRRSPFCQ